MNEHTSGLEVRKEERPSGIPRIIIGDGFNDVGEVYTCADESFGWPDARLWAAAPELLEACQYLCAEIHNGCDRKDEAFMRGVEMVRAIIAKAQSSNRVESRSDVSN